ncbi:hypothetical protein MANES_03G095616v8 [Manihot esculenta]|uniref:Uncharacterized protein n=1 Tax=Manihot esculenta TaxID=3983 RepID=A0ACB7HZU4_MANES|nr:hypothetical protein MANES_03G095616v8 [Manihot esculenta]
MAQIQRPKSIIDFLGEEIIRIITPVSICMFIVVILVSSLNTDSSSTSTTINTIATMAYTETTSDSFWDKLRGTLLNSLVFVAVVTVVTFLLVLLFYLRCTQLLKIYMGFLQWARAYNSKTSVLCLPFCLLIIHIHLTKKKKKKERKKERNGRKQPPAGPTTLTFTQGERASKSKQQYIIT